MTVLEDRIRTVLASQSATMGTSVDEPAAGQLVPVIELASRRRPRLLFSAAAAVLVIGGGVALAQRTTDSPAADQPAAPVTFHFETPTVLLDAASVEVTVAGTTFEPTSGVQIAGDPGTPIAYTTLELTWHQHDVEQRIFIYFTSDGTKWWADEIRTYDGQPNGEWIERRGKFFESPLGTAYTGDLDLPNLKIRGMRLEAFRRPSSCNNPTTPLALVANYPAIDSAAGGYGATLQVVNTATCQPIAVSGFTFEYTSDDPTIAAVADQQLPTPSDYPPDLTRVDLELVSPGTTTIHAVARESSGNVVGTADMYVVVRPADTTIVGDTRPPTP